MKCIEKCLGLKWDRIEIKRTKGRKPFVSNAQKPSHMPNFNFNVSHEGDYIVLASEPVCIVGVDVAAPGQIRRRKDGQFSLEETFHSFRDQFTQIEWQSIRELETEKAQEEAFRRNWSCKEAFTKARGDGIGFELKRCQFDIREEDGLLSPSCTHHANVCVDGRPLGSWRFFLQSLGDHWVSVARGPPSDIVDAHGEFTRTLSKRTFTNGSEWKDEIAAPSPGFTLVGIRY